MVSFSYSFILISDAIDKMSVFALNAGYRVRRFINFAEDYLNSV